MRSVLAALFGLVLGSFLNVCIFRVPRDMSVVTPRSFCPECGARIAALRNIPLLSYVLLKGRCHDCGQPIGWRYPVVEALTALLFALAIARYGMTLVAFKWVLFESLMVVLFFTDFEERILPDEFTLGGLAAGALLALFTPVPSLVGELVLGRFGPRLQSEFSALIAALVLAVPIWVLAAVYSRLRHREALGLGDVKLLALFGVFLGLENGIKALMIASICGSLAGVLLLARHRSNALHFELPFGSFLCGAAMILPIITTLA